MLSAGRKNFGLEMKWGGENAKEKQKNRGKKIHQERAKKTLN